MSDQDIWNLKRGGHDYRKVYAAYRAAMEHKGQPTVILAHDHQGLHPGLAFRGAQRHPSDEKACAARPQVLPRYPAHPDLRRPSSRKTRICRRTTTPARRLPEIRYMLDRRRALGGFLPGTSHQVQGAHAARPRHLQGAQEGLGQPGGGHHHGHRAHVQRVVARQGDWAAHRSDHPGRGPHVRHGLVVPQPQDLQPQRPALHRRGRRVDAGVQGIRNRPDPARGHQRGRLDGIVHRRGHVLRHAERADDPGLHLLLDVRVPAHRRRVLGRRRPNGARLRPRRHRRAHHVDR